MSLSYEKRRTELWRDAYKNAKEFEYDNYPTAKVVSFFCERKPSDPEIDITKHTPQKEVDYDRVVDVSWFKERLNKTLQYKKKWYGDVDIYNFVVLQCYLDQCINGGYTKAVLSTRELAMLLPKKK